MARPERLLDPTASPLQAFALELRKLRAQAGSPKYLQMQRQSGRSRTALAEAAGGDHLPTWETTDAYVRVCGGDVAEWRLKWERVQEQVRPGPGSAVPALPQEGGVDASAYGATTDPPQLIDPVSARSGGHADVWLKMWQEQRAQARQSENQRAVVTVVVVAVAVSAFGYLAVHHGSQLVSLLVAVGVCLLGLFGAVITGKYYERFKMHMDSAQAIRGRLDTLFPDLHLLEDWSANRVRHEQNFSVLYNLRLHHLWVGLHLGIATAGVAAVAVVLTTG